MDIDRSSRRQSENYIGEVLGTIRKVHAIQKKSSSVWTEANTLVGDVPDTLSLAEDRVFSWNIRPFFSAVPRTGSALLSELEWTSYSTVWVHPPSRQGKPPNSKRRANDGRDMTALRFFAG